MKENIFSKCNESNHMMRRKECMLSAINYRQNDIE